MCGVLSNCSVISVMKIDGTLIELAKPSTIRVVHGAGPGWYTLNDGILCLFTQSPLMPLNDSFKFKLKLTEFSHDNDLLS